MVPLKEVTDWLAWLTLAAVVVFVGLLVGIVLLFAFVGFAKADTGAATAFEVWGTLVSMVVVFFGLAIAEGEIGDRFGDGAAIAWRFISVLLCILMAWFLFGKVARADEGPIHQHHPLHAEFYSKWMQAPARSVSCCNQKDCYPTPIKFEDGFYWALRREDQKWLKINPSKLEQNQPDGNIVESPDFHSHACIAPPEYDDNYDQDDDFDPVFCATIGGAN